MSDPLADLARLDGVPSAVTAARDAVDAVLRDRGLRQISVEASATALLAGARASAALESKPDRWLAGSVRLSTELISLSGLARTAPGQALARAHTLLAAGLVPDDQLGRARAAPAVSERLVGLSRLLTGPTTASGLVVAAIAHAEVATIEPFDCGNGIIARALEHLVLISAGIDPRAVIVIEAGHLRTGDGYLESLRAYRTGTPAGVRTWILHCAAALSYGAEVSPVRRE